MFYTQYIMSPVVVNTFGKSFFGMAVRDAGAHHRRVRAPQRHRSPNSQWWPLAPILADQPYLARARCPAGRRRHLCGGTNPPCGPAGVHARTATSASDTAPAATPVRAPVHNPFVADPSFTPLTGTRAYSGEVGRPGRGRAVEPCALGDGGLPAGVEADMPLMCNLR